MKRLIAKTLSVIALTILPQVLWSTNGYCNSPQPIYNWVARQMKIENVSSMPVINYVAKDRLQQVFQEFSYKSLAKMESDYGKDHAREMLELYLDNVVGLYHPETRIIYIGEFLEPCRRQAVLAHELTHYYQHIKGGRIHSDDYGADDKRSYREMEAYHMEREFEKIFCDPIDGQTATNAEKP